MSVEAYKKQLIHLVITGEITHKKAKRMFDNYTKIV